MIEAARPILKFLCDVEVVLGLMYIMPTLEVINDLIKLWYICGGSENVLCRFAHIVLQPKEEVH
jgi:hypothetical protein